MMRHGALDRAPSPAWVVLGALGIALGACKDEAEPPGDAGPTIHKLSVPDLGVSVILPTGWVEDPVESDPLVGESPTALPPGQRVRTVARGRRVPSERPFLVAPRALITVEPTARKNPEEAFRAAMDDLEKLDQRDNVEITRSAMSTRFMGPEPIGDLEIAYKVRAGKAPPQEIVQRSLVILRRPPTGSRAIVTITATYLAKDAEMVSSEVQAILNSLSLEEATTKEQP